MDISELKEYLKVDGTEDDALIKGLQSAAENYLTNAGCIKDYNNDLYKLAVMLLVSHWYENRQIEQIGGNINKLSFSLQSIIAQLKYCQPGVIT